MVEAERKVISEAGGEGSDAGEVLAGLTKEEKKKAIKQNKKSATMSLEQFNNKSEVSTNIAVNFLPLTLPGQSAGGWTAATVQTSSPQGEADSGGLKTGFLSAAADCDRQGRREGAAPGDLQAD